ncbi:MAG: lysophospholipid acyltransferase family protein [Thermoguttaceae bacterium]
MLPPLATELLAWCVLLGLGTAAGLAAGRALARSPLSMPQSLLIGLNYVLVRVLWRGSVRGSLDLSPDRGAVIVSNHRAPVDPTFLYLSTNRIVHWMVAKEYCVLPILSWFFRTAQCIPVNRGGIDTKATKSAIRYAERGGLVGMFPEGRINKTRDVLLPGRPGAALIALRARVPIVPMYVEGSPFDGTVFGCLFMTAKTTLTIGKPMDLSAWYDRGTEREVQQAVTLQLLREIARLSGQEDFVPRLAGRNYREPESNWRREEE